MNLETFFLVSQWFFISYFILQASCYLMLNFSAMISISRYMGELSLSKIQGAATADVMPPISLIVPAYNEELTIINSIQALLQLDYPEYEIIVINDGSTDNTFQKIIDYFELKPFPEAYRQRLKTQPVKQFYTNKQRHKLRFIDKENGGKADAINVGINASRYPLFCTVDADSILQHNSLQRIVQPFLDDPSTVASGGTVRVVNGCSVKKGFMYKAGLPKNYLALFQIVEYIRAFLFGRLGWSPMNALLIISGAFGLFHKETVVSVGGYSADTIGEDMELVVRLHRLLRKRKQKYRITFVPDPICWTEAPESLRVLQHQRIRWQRGLAESLSKNMGLLFHPKSGALGFLAFPFMMFFEWLGPVVEVFGYIIITVGFATDFINLHTFLVLMGIAVGFGILLSVTALLLEEMSFHIYERPVELFRLFLATIVENFGYRQLNSVWRLIGLVQWVVGKKAAWGEMTRSSNWQKDQSSRAND